MITFRNGPAVAATGLFLKRAPIFLRVTLDRTHKPARWDALDQPEDATQRHEHVFAYRRVSGGSSTYIHVNRGRKSFSGYFASAHYELVTPQPDEPTMRDNMRWREWCYAQVQPQPGAST